MKSGHHPYAGNKHNLALIDEILAKARPVKSADGTQTHCAGLSHREASVLLACDIPEKGCRDVRAG